jgi:hypothetical protein
MLLDHVVAGRIEASSLLLTRTVTTLGGTELRVRMLDGRLTVGGAAISKVDVSAGNGTIRTVLTDLWQAAVIGSIFVLDFQDRTVAAEYPFPWFIEVECSTCVLRVVKS